MAVPQGVAKTCKKRTLPVSPFVAREVKRLLALRPLEWWEAPVFCRSGGQELLVSAFKWCLQQYYNLQHSGSWQREYRDEELLHPGER